MNEGQTDIRLRAEWRKHAPPFVRYSSAIDEWMGAWASIPRSKEKLRLLCYALLFLIDVTGFIVGFLTVDIVRHGAPSKLGFLMVAVSLPLFVLVMFQNRAYTLEVLVRRWLGVRRAIISMLVALAITIGVLYYVELTDNFSRLLFTAGGVFSLGLISTGRAVSGRYLSEKYGGKFVNEVVLVDGISAVPSSGDLVLFADRLDVNCMNPEPSVLDSLSQLLVHFDRVVLACSPERRPRWTDFLKGLDVDVEVLMPELAKLGALGLRRLGRDPTLLVGCAPMGLVPRAVKRVFDLVTGSLAVLALAPLMLLIAIAIKVDSPGPVFFRQFRVGRGNRWFPMLKFRTMRADCDDLQGVRSTARQDDRVTRLGRFLRRTSLDELPQFLNVVMGHMSVVGPRPHAPASTAEDQLFWKIDSRYFHRHAVKPGITGLAQVRGYRGATEHRVDLTNRLQADLEYLADWSIGKDILIILRTFRVVIHDKAF